MWRRTVLVLHLLVIKNSSQLDSNGTEAPVKCCPCPGEPGSGPALLEPEGPRLRSAPPGPAGADGCPCLARDADADADAAGAASMFFPHAVRAFGNSMKSEPKEDAKPLLHPEVDLASSVLETLREATSEEYREALERDAARAAADVMQPRVANDAPEDARNVVTIIVSPQDMDATDDILPEASHLQETRCIHPSLGNARDSYRSQVHKNGLEAILNLPLPGGLLHRQRDSNPAASDAHESIVKPESNMNRLLSGLKLRSNPSFFKLNKNKNFNLNQDKNIQSEGRTPINSIVETSPVTDKEISEDITDGAISDDLGVLNTDCERQSVSSEEALETIQTGLDSDPSPNNFNEELIETSGREDNARENELSLPKSKSPQLSQNIIEPSQKPFPLKSLFKLRDVELIPLDINKIMPKSKLNIPNLKFDTFQNEKARTNSFDAVKIPKLTDLFRKPSKILKGNVDLDNLENRNAVDKENSDHIQAVGKRKEFTTEILDAVPSPSVINNVVTANKECLSLESHADKSSNGEFEEVSDLLDNDTNEDNVSDAETKTDSIHDDEDLTNITDLESVENFDSKTSERDQTSYSSISEILGENGDSYKQGFSSEEIKDVPPSAIDLSELSKPEERSQEVIDNHHSSKNLDEIRRSVVEKLDALQINNRNALNNIRHSMEEISEMAALHSKETEVARSGEEISELDTDIVPCSPTDELKEASAEDISFADLQNMSDSILEASEKTQHNTTAMNVDPQNSLEINESETVNNIKTDDEETVQSKDPEFENEIGKTLLEENVRKDINLCPSDLVKSSDKELSKSGSGNHKYGAIDNDLEPLASEPLANSVFRPNPKSLAEHLSDIESRLRQNIIVQPASLIRPSHLNIFRTPTLSIPDISDLNTNIPTLGEIRTRVSEILSGLARQVDDDDVSSEPDSDDFASNDHPVLSTSASSSKPVSVLSPLQPLEDINLDIIQLKPIPLISGTNPLRSSLPGLNLNTYQAKLAVPKSLNLKPLNLASTFGTGGGLLGARLSVEPEKKGKLVKNRGKAKKNDISTDRSLGRIGSTLADVTARMQNNARNILNIPKSVSEQTLQASNTLENFAENIRSHTENSIRNIHRNINSPFDEVRPTSKKPSAKVFSSSRNALNTPQSNFVENLKIQTGTSIKDLHERLTSPLLAHENTLLSSGNLNDMVDNLKAQTENTFRNIQESLSMAPLTDINDSVHKTTKNILKSSAVLTPGMERLEEGVQTLGSAVNNLLSQTEIAMKNIQQTNIPSLSEVSKSIQKSANNVLKSTKTKLGTEYLKSTLQPSLSLETAVENLRSQSHAQDLLKSPNTLRNILQAPAPIDLKPNTEKVVKDIQKTFKATLRNSPVKDLHKLANPENIVQMISNHQEDVNDKLFAIHTDLNDRLESLHNEVMDPERLKSILSPHSNRAFELFAIPLPNNRLSYPLSRNAGLKTKQPSINREFKDIRKSTPKHKTGAMMRAPSTGKGRDQKTFKMSKAASAPITARTNKPILPLSPKKPSLTKSLDRDSSRKPALSKPDTLKSLHGIKKTLLPKHKPLVENKIKVTFASTTHKPPPAQKPVVTSTAKPKVSGIKRFKPKPPVRQPTPWNGWGESRSASEATGKGDPIPSPSRTVPKIRTPSRHHPATLNDKIGSHLGASSRLKPLRKLKPQPIMKLTPPSQGRASDRESKSMRSPEKPTSTLLSKLTDALKNKRTKANLRSSPDLDVAPAPSEHVEKVIALDEPMKENVSYKCKMMCVKLE